MQITKSLKTFLVSKGLATETWTSDDLYINACNKGIDDGTITVEEVSKHLNQKTPSDIFGSVRLKKPSERYSTTKSVGKHVRSGLPVKDERGREVQTTSELETVKSGVLLKKLAQRGGLPVSLSEHESELLEEMYDSDQWCGKFGSEYQTGIPGSRVKSLLNDATSGGSELVPEFFDEAIVQFPLLHSELLPKVDLRDVPRGSTVETASVGNPTATWGTPEGTSMGLFDTAGLVAGIDTSIFPLTTAVEIGKDFMADAAAADIGRILLENIGQRMLNELDKAICIGDGNTMPEGLFNASSIADIGNPAGGAGAAPQVDDYESLLFAIPKQYRGAMHRCAFVANDTTFQRAKSIPVGSADERRVFGMTHEDYMLLHRPFLIQNDIANNVAGFFALERYRLYRRQGQSVMFTDQGKENALKNQTLLVVRSRYGGKLLDPLAGAFSDNWKA